MSGPDALLPVMLGGALALLLIGAYAMVARRHLIRILVGLMLMEAGANLALVAAGFRPGAAAPILGAGSAGPMVDPIPQALILTAIVIGVGVIAFALALVVRVHRAYGTVDGDRLGRILARHPEAADEARPGSDPEGRDTP